jgi:hypothetical protein
VAHQALRRLTRWLVAHQWLVAVVLIFATIGYTQYATTHARHGALAETCKFIDADHDAKRTDLVTDLKRLFRPPYTATFKLSRPAAHKAYRDTKRRYDHIIDTRPKYCQPRTPIKPFPSYHEVNPQSKP